jgi:phage terminase small subunit
MANGKLTAKQSKFVSEYLICFNATRAAIAAGYSKKTARSMGSQLLTHINIQAELQRGFEAQGMQPAEILARLADQARGDIGDLIDESTMTVNWRKALQEGKTHLVKKVKQTIITTDDQQTEILELELYDAQRALVNLGRTYALFADKLQVETWQDRAIEDIRSGVIMYEDLEREFDTELATQLFTRAGVPISLPENTG